MHFIFGETSAKTGEGVNDIFLKSIEEIEKNIEGNYYDFNSEECGIKKRSINNVKNIDLKSEGSSKKRKGCYSC